MSRVLFIGLIALSVATAVSVMVVVYAFPAATGQALSVRERNGTWTGTMFGSMQPLEVGQHGNFVTIRSAGSDAGHPSLAWDTTTQQLTVSCIDGYTPRIISQGRKTYGTCKRNVRK